MMIGVAAGCTELRSRVSPGGDPTHRAFAPLYGWPQTDQGGARYRGVFSAFRQIAETEGVRGLYSGVSPTMQRASLVAAAELATYDEIKSRLIGNGLMVSDKG